jgi:hypothetical protein
MSVTDLLFYQSTVKFSKSMKLLAGKQGRTRRFARKLYKSRLPPRLKYRLWCRRINSAYDYQLYNGENNWNFIVGIFLTALYRLHFVFLINKTPKIRFENETQLWDHAFKVASLWRLIRLTFMQHEYFS